jgi:lipoprotein-anchoring transpeptidase ErfK/SrfK
MVALIHNPKTDVLLPHIAASNGNNHRSRNIVVALVVATAGLWSSAAQPQALAMTSESNATASIFRQVVSDRGANSEADPDRQIPTRLHRQVVHYYATGTIIIDTPNTYLYFVLGGGKAIRYGIGVGRDGFTWSGVKSIERKSEWPDWISPAEMLRRQPYLPRFMAGGPGNPLGARHVSGWHRVSHSRHQRAGDDRQARFKRLHPHAQR